MIELLEGLSGHIKYIWTSMEDIQHAYQGFAKQNYTMLDNLKLGRRAIAQL